MGTGQEIHFAVVDLGSDLLSARILGLRAKCFQNKMSMFVYVGFGKGWGQLAFIHLLEKQETSYVVVLAVVHLSGHLPLLAYSLHKIFIG